MISRAVILAVDDEPDASSDQSRTGADWRRLSFGQSRPGYGHTQIGDQSAGERVDPAMYR